MINYFFNRKLQDIANRYISKKGLPIRFTTLQTYRKHHSTTPLPCPFSFEYDNMHVVVFNSKIVLLWYFYFKPYKHVVKKSEYPELLI